MPTTSFYKKGPKDISLAHPRQDNDQKWRSQMIDPNSVPMQRGIDAYSPKSRAWAPCASSEIYCRVLARHQRLSLAEYSAVRMYCRTAAG